MGALGLASIIPAIEANTSLAALNDMRIGTAGISAHSLRVRNMTDPVYEMVLVHVKLRAHEARDLVYLDVAANNMGVEGARLLRTALLQCTRLEELVLRSNALRSAGVQIIAGAFHVLSRLTALDLRYAVKAVVRAAGR